MTLPYSPNGVEFECNITIQPLWYHTVAVNVTSREKIHQNLKHVRRTARSVVALLFVISYCFVDLSRFLIDRMIQYVLQNNPAEDGLGVVPTQWCIVTVEIVVSP